MEILPSVIDSCGAESVRIVTSEVENTPCKMIYASCVTPTVQQAIMTLSPEADHPQANAEGAPPSCQAEMVAKPPLIPIRMLDIKLSDTENDHPPQTMEMNSKALILPVKAVAVLKEMPFKERNREEGKRMIPPHIKVPPKKLFGYPERYKSPTDAMVSPISKGLLARNRRPARTLAPVVPPKALENTFQDVVVNGEGGKSE